MAVQQVLYNFTENGVPAMFISEEMSSRQIGRRAIQFASDVPIDQWGSSAAKVSEDINRHFAERAPCYILEGCRNVDRVAEEIRRFVEEKKVGVAAIDYAQLLAKHGKNRYDEITHVSDTLKKVAKDCNIPLLVLCQMSREIESRAKFIPLMSDIKESGQFEQDADVIVFQVWPFKLDPAKFSRELYQFFILKNRNRDIGSPMVTCKFLPARQKLVYANTPDDYSHVFDQKSTTDVYGLEFPDFERGQETNGDF